MVDINHVVLIGRLTRDAELKSLASGQAVCKFSIAVNRRRKVGENQWEDEPNFFDIVLWGRQGESLHQYLVKGKAVCVDGELRQDRWQQDGQNRSKVEVVANYIQLLGSAPSGNSGGAARSSGSSAPQGGQAAPAEMAEDSFADDIPF